MQEVNVLLLIRQAIVMSERTPRGPSGDSARSECTPVGPSSDSARSECTPVGPSGDSN